MSTPIKDGGPAFPRPGFLSTVETPEQLIAQYENKPETGMTLRDWFAGKALPGVLEQYFKWASNDLLQDVPPEVSISATGSELVVPPQMQIIDDPDFYEEVAEAAYAVADAMLAARSKSKP